MRAGVDVPPPFAQVLVVDTDGRRAGRSQLGPVVRISPRPGIAEPEVGQDVQGGGLGPTVDGRDPAQDVLLIRLGILDEHVEIASRPEGIADRVD